jgi:hypothetical protein
MDGLHRLNFFFFNGKKDAKMAQLFLKCFKKLRRQKIDKKKKKVQAPTFLKKQNKFEIQKINFT